MLRKGEWVWVDSTIGVPIGARVKKADTNQCLLVDDEGKERVLKADQQASARPMHATSVEGVDDMIQLGDLSEAGLLRNLLVRHRKGLIYTYTGSVLVAVNPYKDLPLYTQEQVKLYHGQKLGELPPHVFAIADTCYYNLKRYDTDQCCIISGESGAGKTESSKLILQYLAAISGRRSNLEQQILESNPILEAFGNAKTIRNDNSSRFGKYLEISFNQDGAIEGARVEQYLLEKCRVCHQAEAERNFHIFYCMLAGLTAEQKKKLSLKDAKAYKFLTRGGSIVCNGRDDAKDFGRIGSALKVLTFRESQSWEIYKLLAAILHLGNISFEETSQNNMDSSNVCSSEHFSLASSMLEVPADVLEKSMTQRSFLTNRETVTKPLNKEQAADCRDALVKAVYNKMFLWIVGKINGIIGKAVKEDSGSSHRSIGLLDIFGFENFLINSFEQLCINLANEKLQQFFVVNIFELEQKEYLRQGVVWDNITFSDNKPTLELLVSKPCNLLAMIDEESQFPKGTDSTMLYKMNQQHKENKGYVSSKNEHDSQFGIKHFAGQVFYDSNGFLEKNRDAISSNIIMMISISKNKLLHDIFKSELSNKGVKKSANNKVTIITPTHSLRAMGDKKQMPTLSGQFRRSLESLMKTLDACQPFFIRCFKPNKDKNSEGFDRELCMVQLRYSGMMDTVRIRKLGFPIRHTFKDFMFRYRVLLNTAVCDPKKESDGACCQAICTALIRGKDQWKVGKSKLFLKDAHDSILEQARELALAKVVLIIQRVMFGLHDRRSYLKKKAAVRVLQTNWRAYKKRERGRKLRLGYARLSARVRGRRLQLLYEKQRSAAVVLQTQVRGYLARKSWKQQKEDAFNAAREQELLARARQEQTLALAAIELQKLADAAAESQRASQEPEPISDDEDSDVGGDNKPAPQLVSVAERAAPKNVNNYPVVEIGHKALKNIAEETSSSSSSDTEEDLPKTTKTPPSAGPAPPPPGKTEEVEEKEKKKKKKEEEEEEEPFKEDKEFSFQKFCSLHFQGDASHTHISQRLREPLLAHQDERDSLACLTVWWIILRFMGDMVEPRAPDPSNPQARRTSSAYHPSMVQRQGRRLSSMVGLDQKILRKNKKKYGGGNRRASTIPEEPEDAREEDVLIGEGPTLDRPLTPLEKLHIIVGYGLSRPGIRDEIFCQILKQLMGNGDKEVCLRGWTLLSMCLSSFPPSQILIKYLENFLRRGPKGYAAYCADRLRRTVANGEREEVPCEMELQATESKKPMDVTVSLMDGRKFTLQVDAACTSGEVLREVAQKINLSDTYGFSLYISIMEKRWSLGSSGKHVMDSVSQCEHAVRQQGSEESRAPWQLWVRKEMFTPWHDCAVDPVSTELIYRQVLLGLKAEEYVCDKEDEYAQLAAKHYFVQFGAENTPQNTRRAVEDCITSSLIDAKSRAKWNQLVGSIHAQGRYRSKDVAKAGLVDYARQKWSLFFSKFYAVTMQSGPPLPLSRFALAINSTGVSFMDGKDTKLLEIPNVELTGATVTSDSRPVGGCLRLSTFQDEFVLRCAEAAEAAKMIQTNLEGLRQRSQYAVAMQELGQPDDPSVLVCKRGELLVVGRDGDFSAARRWNTATNNNSGLSGTVQMNTIQFLSTLDMPSEATLNLLNPGYNQPRALAGQGPTQREEAVAPVSIKEFALENFGTRTAGKDLNRVGATQLAFRERLWVTSKEPLKQPLLRTLTNNSELSTIACNAFVAILKYMGDYPIKHARSPMELTDQIFGPATQHPALQDEIYCQIMKQMTNNRNRVSMELGWQLLWLCTGLFPPSNSLAKHAHRFLKSRPRDPLASDCLKRLQNILSLEPRQHPPHYAEVDAIHRNSTQIYHKVTFPNEADELFEVTSTTTIRDLCSTIATQLNLSSPDGYGLFMKTAVKVSNLDDEMYFFDSLRQNAEPPKKIKKAKEATPSAFLVFFMRKLWFNVIPGRDLTADLTFHYPQEMPRYLRGYHNCSREDMIELAALLFRIQTDSDRSQFVMIPRMLKELVPDDQIDLMSSDDWKKNIISSYNQQMGITADEARVNFLKVISSWPTFGCTFFEVKQTCEPSYPTNMRIAISKVGVSFIDPKTKELLVMHPFGKITDWQTDNHHFHMSIGGLVQGTFSCETPLGYKMEDLLLSYISMYEKERLSVLPRSQMFS